VYRRAVVPLDGSPAAEGILPFILDIAGPLDMEVQLLRVVQPIPPVAIEGSPQVIVDDEEARWREAEEYLVPIGLELGAQGVRVHSSVRRGVPAAEIVAAARELGADLIAMTTHGRSGLGRLVFGSVAQAVLHQAEVPVLLMRATRAEVGATAAREASRGRRSEPRSHSGRDCAAGRPSPLASHREPLTTEETAMRVRELMTGALVCVPTDTPVLNARHLMLEKRIRHLLVTDADNGLKGIVTDRDIRLNLPSQATSLSVWELNHLLTKLTVGAVMTTSVITVGPDDDARDAGQLMLDHTIGALPVLDGGRLIGIITETDLLRAFVRSGEKLASLRAR
jgi:CBS domain-containing protein/nucleotide-binding universal stress UspA family protein